MDKKVGDWNTMIITLKGDRVLVSVNGDKENPVEKLLDLPASEYEAALAEIERIKNPTSPEK